MTTIKDRARAYISAMPPAISGAGGDNATFAVARALVKGFDLDEASAFDLFMEWNAHHAVPPWRANELRAKLRSALNSGVEAGYLLKENASRAYQPPVIQPRPSDKSRAREQWPHFSGLTQEAIEAVARLRKLPVDVIVMATRMELLRSAIVHGHPCFVITEGGFAQARRMDGGLLPTANGDKKTKNLFGSEGAFIGGPWLGDRLPVLLVEGAIGLLEAIAAVYLARRDHAMDWTVLAATSAYSRFSRAPNLLAQLRGRRVRIVPDDDPAGFDGAAEWLSALIGAGADAEAIRLPRGHKDLGPIVAAHEAHADFFTTLFQ